MGDRGRSRSRSRSPKRDARGRDRSRDRDDRGGGGGGGGGGGRLKGIAQRWNERGFGFIKPSDGSEDLFCHFSAITDGNALSEGAEVEYTRGWDDRKQGFRATDVTGGTQEDRGGGGGGGGGFGGGAPTQTHRGFSGPPAGDRQRGIAQRWNERGFGFIKPQDGSEDLFCHFSAITDGNCLMQGAEVEYTRSYDESKGNYRASEVVGGATEQRGGGGGGRGGGYGGGCEHPSDFHAVH